MRQYSQIDKGLKSIAFEKRSRLFSRQIVGYIPASEGTPDIYFSDDLDSRKIALFSFLTIWFMSPVIRSYVKKGISKILCSITPVVAGPRMLHELLNEEGVSTSAKNKKRLGLNTLPNNSIGYCYMPHQEDGIFFQGRIAVYGGNKQQDDQYGVSQRLRSIPKYHTEVGYDDNIFKLFDCLWTNSNARDSALAELLGNEFAKCTKDFLIREVPLTVAHEVIHALQGLGYLPDSSSMIKEEVRQVIPEGCPKYNYYRDEFEAVAELGGISLVRQVQRNANLPSQLPVGGLDKKLPVSYQYISKEIARLSRS